VEKCGSPPPHFSSARHLSKALGLAGRWDRRVPVICLDSRMSHLLLYDGCCGPSRCRVLCARCPLRSRFGSVAERIPCNLSGVSPRCVDLAFWCRSHLRQDNRPRRPAPIAGPPRSIRPPPTPIRDILTPRDKPLRDAKCPSTINPCQA
jgi:hypothetical protein